MLRPITCIALLAIVSALSFSEAKAQVSIFKTVQSPSTNIRGNTFNAVAGLSPTEAWAVGFQSDNQLNGSRTLTDHWNGKTWNVVASPNPGSTPECQAQNSGNMLNAVAEITPTNVWAAGFQFNCHGLLTTMMLQGNCKSWHVVATPALRTNDNSAFNGLAALAADNVFAVGYQPAANGAVLTLIEQFNGSAWSVVPSPNGNSTGNVLQAIRPIRPRISGRSAIVWRLTSRCKRSWSTLTAVAGRWCPARTR